MHCQALQRGVSSPECCEYILSLQHGGQLAVCRACPAGLAMMDTIKPAGNYYEPETLPVAVEKEIPAVAPECTEEGMQEERKRYSYREFADMVGLEPKDISYVKHASRYFKSFRAGSKTAKVIEAMREKGISWDDLYTEKGSGPKPRKNREAIPLVAPEDGMAAPALPLSEELDAFSVAAASTADVEGEFEAAFAGTLADLNAEQAGPEAAQAPLPFIPRRPDYGRDFTLGHIPMEALVCEITRRMPGARIVLC